MEPQGDVVAKVKMEAARPIERERNGAAEHHLVRAVLIQRGIHFGGAGIIIGKDVQVADALLIHREVVAGELAPNDWRGGGAGNRDSGADRASEMLIGLEQRLKQSEIEITRRQSNVLVSTV